MLWLYLGISILAALLLLVGVIVAIGRKLPSTRSVACSMKLAHPPETVWQTITDYANVPRWHRQVKRAERLPDRNGHEVWRELHRGGAPLQLETIASEPPHRLVRSILDEKKVFSGRWEFELTPTPEGCCITITEHGEVQNPFFRFMWHKLMHPAMYIERYFQSLAKKLGEEAVIESRA
jgi:uncharacterized protein YndB with AHSA1/START domain